MEIKKTFEEVHYQYTNEELMKTHCQHMIDEGWVSYVQEGSDYWVVIYRKKKADNTCFYLN